MSELLAPAGSYEAFLAAISNGCDAVYLGLNSFSARAYAENFNIDNLEEIIRYAHLRNVKVYVTMNTIVYESELNEAYKAIDKLNELGVDGVIVQDLALFTYIKDNFKELEAHASTQTGIDHLNGIRFFEELKADRVVLARETSIDDIRNIKKNSKMPLELFIHGALCVSYSGNCLMSGLIGLRSGNRGRCVGSCRKSFTLRSDQKIGEGYILSMKDLNTTKYIEQIQIADSLKIEGRMKDPSYVASVVRNYRMLLDGTYKSIEEVNLNLAKTFNRTFTKGYLFGEDKKNITNIEKPNNYGYKIGTIGKINKNRYQLILSRPLKQGDQIRIASAKEINIPITKLYDSKGMLINEANNCAFIEMKDTAKTGDAIYKTMDIDYLNEMKSTYPREYKTYPIEMTFVAKANEPLYLAIKYENIIVEETYGLAQKALKAPTSDDQIATQMAKLGDTPYRLSNIDIYTDNCSFISIKELNELRRRAINRLDNERYQKRSFVQGKPKYEKISFDQNEKPLLVAFCNTQEQYDACLDKGIKTIYYKNVARRNHINYEAIDGTVLVGGYGGIHYYQGQEIISDFSLNVVNAKTVNLLHTLGVNRVTLSHEINNRQIKELINEYQKNCGGNPNLEMIVYGRVDLLFTKYCPLKKFALCGKCKNTQYYLDDDIASFPIISHEDCTTTILNSKILNLIDDLGKIKGINAYRLQFTIESYDEVCRVIDQFQSRLDGNTTPYFDEKINTRGHFNKEIL